MYIDLLSSMIMSVCPVSVFSPLVRQKFIVTIQDFFNGNWQHGSKFGICISTQAKQWSNIKFDAACKSVDSCGLQKVHKLKHIIRYNFMCKDFGVLVLH